MPKAKLISRAFQAKLSRARRARCLIIHLQPLDENDAILVMDKGVDPVGKTC